MRKPKGYFEQPTSFKVSVKNYENDEKLKKKNNNNKIIIGLICYFCHQMTRSCSKKGNSDRPSSNIYFWQIFFIVDGIS